MPEDANEVQKRIEGRIGELPADIQDAIFSSDFNQKIQNIGNVAGLHIDKIQELGDNTMLVMLGFMSEDEYRKEVTDLADQDATKAQKLVDEVNKQIFLSIRESMKAFAARQAAPAPAAPNPPEMHPADVLLTEKTVVTPPKPQESTSSPSLNSSSSPTEATGTAQKKAEPPKPTNYKADPYREPIN